MARSEFPKSVRVTAIKRCCDASGTPRCEQCHAALKAGGFAFDHIVADGLTGKPTIENCQVLCAGPGSCHDRKTRDRDVPAIAKAKRNEARHLGISKRSTLKGAKLPKGCPSHRATTSLHKRASGPSEIARRMGGQV